MKKLNDRLTVLLHAMTGRTAFALCYLVACVLFYPLRTTANRMYQYLLFPWAVALAYPLLTRRVHTHRPGLFVLIAFFVWFLFSCFINRSYSFFSSSGLWLTHIAVLFVLYPQPEKRGVPDVLREAELVAHLLAALLLPIYLCGIYASLVQRPIDIGLGIPVGMIGEQRLHIFGHPNTVASVAMTSLLLSWYAAIRCKGILRAAHVLNVCVMFLGVALAQSRTSTLALCAAAAVVVFCALHGRMRRVLPAVAAAALTAVLCLVLQQSAWPALASLSNRVRASVETSVVQLELSPSPVTAAPSPITAEPTVNPPSTEQAPAPRTDLSDQAIDVQVRSIDQHFSTFTGRTALWSGALAYLRDHPVKILTGVTQLGVQENLIPYCPEIETVGDVHNSYVQLLVSVGLPGLLLILLFFVCQVRPVVRVLWTPAEGGMRGAYVLPAIAIALGVVSLMETVLLSANNLSNPVFFLTLGWTACLAQAEK